MVGAERKEPEQPQDNRAELSLSVTKWSLRISCQREDAPMAVDCIAIDDHQLVLSSGEDIARIPIYLLAGEGPLTFADWGKSIEFEEAIGFLSYHPKMISCFIGLEPDLLKETWMQFRSNAFSECSISLDLGLEYAAGHDQAVWQIAREGPPWGRLFVLGVSFEFAYSRR